MMIKRIVICIVAFILSGNKNMNAQSLYSAGGIGELRHFLHVRASGIGGSGLALKDKFSANLINPSLWAFLEHSSINGSLIYEGLKFKFNNENYNLDKSQLYNIGLIVKANKKIAIGLGLSPLSDADYKFKKTNEDNSSTEYLTSTGGLSKIMLGFSVSPKQFFSFGFSANYLLGNYEEIWRVTFQNEELNDMNSLVTTYLKGVQLTGGVNIFYKELISVGLVYNTPAELKSGTKIQTNYVTKEVIKNEVKIPESYGIGIVINMRKDLLLSTDYYRKNFKEISSNGTVLSGFKNSDRISLGFEFAPGEVKKYSYRLGAYSYNSYLDNALLGSVTEKALTFGLSRFLKSGAGRIDFAGIVGLKACSSEFISTEKVFRFILAFSGGEEWFVRNRR